MALIKYLNSHAEKFFKKVSLQTILVVPFVLQIMIAVSVTVWLSLRTSQQAADKVASQLITEAASRTEYQLKTYLDTPLLVNQINADSTRIGQLNTQNLAGLERYFWQQLQRFKSINSISISTEKGEYINLQRLDNNSIQAEVANKSTAYNLVTYATNEQGDRTQLLQTKSNFDPRKLDWYQSAVETGDKSLQGGISPYFSSNKSTLIFEQGLYDAKGKLIGAIAIELMISQISDFLNQIKIGKTGETFIIERSGELVASSSLTPIFQINPLQSKQERVNALDSQDIIIRSTTNYLKNRFGNLSQIQSGQQLDFDLNGNKEFVRVVSFKNNQGVDWLIFVVVPESEFMNDVKENNYSLVLFCIAALFVSSGISIIIARLISRILSNLSSTAAALVDGKWQQRNIKESYFGAEFNLLTRTFSQMKDQLYNSFVNFSQQQASLNEAQKISNLGSWELDAQSDEMIWSEQLFQIFGVDSSIKFPTYENYLELIHPEDVAVVRQAMELAIYGGVPYELDYRVRRPDGVVLDVWAKVQPVFQKSAISHTTNLIQKSVFKVKGTVLDITARKQVENDLKLASANLHTLLESIPGIVAWVSTDLRYLAVNKQLAQIFKLQPEDFIGQNVSFLDSSWQFGEEFGGFLSDFFAGEHLEDEREINILLNDSLETYLVVAQKFDRSQAAFTVGINITQRQQADEALRKAEAKYRNIFENAVEGIFQSTLAGGYISANPALARIYGYDSSEELMSLVYDIENQLYVYPETRKEFIKLLESQKTVLEFEAQVYRKDRSIIWISENARIVDDSEQEQPYYEGIVEDITSRKHSEEIIRYQALHDLLTDLPNRKLFNERLTAAIAQSQTYQSMLAVMFLDLDRFKTVNDSLGHTAGDRLLKNVVQRLADGLDRNIVMSRWGGDEFTLLLPHIRYVEDAIDTAQRVLDILKPAFYIDGHTIHTSSSIGIAIYPDDGEDGATLIKNADAALYYAKEQGRNNCQLYTKNMNCEAPSLLALESSLHHALENGQIVVYYQPKVNINTWTITGMEALVRWKHPEKGLISPKLFIPLAEQSGLIVPLAEMVLRTACCQNKAWQDAGFSALRVAVNLSARQFLQPNLVSLVAKVLNETRLEPQYLELEITETIAMQDTEFTHLMLNELYDMGVHIAIDDFGTGYSSLNYLKNFSLHTIKIDQSFVRDLTIDPYDKAIIAAIVALAHGLGLNVVVEGVETREQLSYLRSLRCEEIQGHLFSPPLIAADITKLLALKSQENTGQFSSWIGI